MHKSQSTSPEPTRHSKRWAPRLGGVPAAIALMVVIAFALVGSAGAGTAKTAVAPANSTQPTISGTAQEGQMLTADKGTWTGTEPIVYSYEWQGCNSGGGSCVTIKNAVNTTYTVTKSDVGNTLRFVVTAKNADGTVTATSAATAVATAAATTARPTNTSPPTISGTAQEGQTLTADKGNWTGTEPITYQYQWQRCNANGGGCGNEGGQTHRDLRGPEPGHRQHTSRRRHGHEHGRKQDVDVGSDGRCQGGHGDSAACVERLCDQRWDGRDRGDHAAGASEYRPVPGQPGHDHLRHPVADRTLPCQCVRWLGPGRVGLCDGCPVWDVRCCERADNGCRRLGEREHDGAVGVPGQPAPAAARDVRPCPQVGREPPRRDLEPPARSRSR